jgi:hypothetical protein
MNENKKKKVNYKLMKEENNFNMIYSQLIRIRT